MFAKKFAYLAAVAFLGFSCTADKAALERERQEQTIVIYETVFRHALAHCQSCISPGLGISAMKSLSDPPDEVFDRIQHDWPSVSKVSKSYPLYYKQSTGERQWLITLSPPRWIDDSTVEINADFHCGMTCASFYLYTVTKSFFTWKVSGSKHVGES